MKKITTQAQLKEEIRLLEIKNESNIVDLKEGIKMSYENLRPVNLIKNTLKELTSAPEFKGNLLNSTIGIGAGYLTKQIVNGSTHSLVKQLLGTLLQVGVTSIVSKNGDGIKLGALKLISSLFKKKVPADSGHI